jgi:hypothetical protein
MRARQWRRAFINDIGGRFVIGPSNREYKKGLAEARPSLTLDVSINDRRTATEE